MRDARGERRFGRRAGLVGLATVAGLFSLFRKRTNGARPARVAVTLPEPATPAAPLTDPTPKTLRDDLRFKGLHAEVEPAGNVRTGEMTCPGCSRNFRYFQNSGGGKTVCFCPGCGRQYRV